MIIIYCKIKIVSQDPGDLLMLMAVIVVLSSNWYDWFSNLERKHFYKSELERKRKNLPLRYTVVKINLLTYQIYMSKVA